MNKMTEENLRRSLADESESQIKWQEFARKADEEGYGNVARVFRATSLSSQVRAVRDLVALDEVKTSLDNLNYALAQSAFNVQQKYPAYGEVAKMQGEENARQEMERAQQSDRQALNLYQEAISSIEAGRDMEVLALFVCPDCGYIAKDRPPANCPLSGTPASEFRGF